MQTQNKDKIPLESNNYEGKTVLITGGTGSLGWSLVTRFLQTDIRRIIIYSRDEFKQYRMEKHFASNRDRLRFFIGDVRDRDRLHRAFSGVDIVIHAAALKHVHLMEYNPIEAVNTNILGARNIIDAAIDRNVKHVVALSTDKAVNPINIYGATKLVSDKLFRSAHSYGGGDGPSFTVVRYGNVVGSRGSVIPFFRDLKQQKSPLLPITDMRMTRFFITMKQSVELVLKALNTGLGGELFISRIPSCCIVDLAKAIYPEAKLHETGIRPGEKLHEVLLTEDEARTTYDYGDFLVVYPPNFQSQPEAKMLPGGTLVPKEFSFSSENNANWLGVDELRRLIEELPDHGDKLPPFTPGGGYRP